LADDVAQIGASLSAASTMDASRVTVGSLSRNFPKALDVLADVVLHPSFPAAEVDRQRAARLGTLVQQRSNSGVIANAVTAAALYGAQHPYGYTENGTTESNKKITREDLQAFWQQHFLPANAALIVAGAITLPELRKLADASFGGWRNEKAVVPVLGSPAPTRARLVVVDRPGVSQTQLRVASIGAERSSPDYFALQVMNEILGGLFSSRINLNLREAHGYTYGAGSSFTFRRTPGPFQVGTSVRTDVTAPAVTEILSEIRKISATTVTPEELSMAKDSIERSLPSLFESVDGGYFDGGTLGSVSDLFIYGLPLNYYSSISARLRAVDAAAVQAAAKKYLVPERMVVVAVGDRASIVQPLEAQLGAAELRDPEAAVIGR
jgi:zinc protease